MPGNRVKETTTTTGTGDLTLAGAVTDYITFNTAEGTNKRFPYSIIDTTNNVWETGFAYLSGTTTLVRDKIVDNSSAGTTALTLSAGTKDVIWGLNSHANGYGSLRGVQNIGTRGISQDIIDFRATGSATTSTNKMNLLPNKPLGTMLATGVNFEVLTTTAAASDTFRFGLYEIKDEGLPGKLIATTADVDLSTTGNKTPSFSASTIIYGGAWYYVGFGMENTLVTVQSFTTGNNMLTPLGLDSLSNDFRTYRFAQHNLAGAWTVLPDDPALNATFGNTTNMASINIIGSIA